MHLARSFSAFSTLGPHRGLLYGNPATPNYRLIVVTLFNANSNALCMCFCLLYTRLAIIRDPKFDPTMSSYRGDPTPIPVPPKGTIWVVPRAPGMAGRTGRLRSRQQPVFRNPNGVPLTRPDQLRPVCRPVCWTCVHHDNVGSFAILLSPPCGGRLIAMLHARFRYGRTDLQYCRGKRAA